MIKQNAWAYEPETGKLTFLDYSIEGLTDSEEFMAGYFLERGQAGFTEEELKQAFSTHFNGEVLQNPQGLYASLIQTLRDLREVRLQDGYYFEEYFVFDPESGAYRYDPNGPLKDNYERDSALSRAHEKSVRWPAHESTVDAVSTRHSQNPYVNGYDRQGFSHELFEHDPERNVFLMRNAGPHGESVELPLSPGGYKLLTFMLHQQGHFINDEIGQKIVNGTTVQDFHNAYQDVRNSVAEINLHAAEGYFHYVQGFGNMMSPKIMTPYELVSAIADAKRGNDFQGVGVADPEVSY